MYLILIPFSSYNTQVTLNDKYIGLKDFFFFLKFGVFLSLFNPVIVLLGIEI